ncbi:MAG TPA: NAD-dependent epimerase/dehydratase family protein [Actinomycetes bacterium]|nr:NAD-dependent epimerase/dehydratase family protein [Actinomycetes bacterium]
MSKRGTAFVIGATGQVGTAAVQALVEDGWTVRAAARTGRTHDGMPDGIEIIELDRDDTAALAVALGDGADVVVDCVAYRGRHARQLLGLADRIGSAVVISSVAVYQDDHGRPFGAPDTRYPIPIPETQATVEPADDDYATGKAALEQQLRAAADRLPVTLLRAGAVHGPRTKHPREWYFVKRALDGRPVRVLAHGGRSRFHTTATANLAELIRLAARRPGTRVLNAADPAAPSTAQISAAVDHVMGVSSELVLIDGPPPAANIGDSPWDIAHPIVLDMRAAGGELDYRPVTSYPQSLPATVGWLIDTARDRDWRKVFPDLVTKYRPDYDFFAYAAEDRWLARRRTQ